MKRFVQHAGFGCLPLMTGFLSLAIGSDRFITAGQELTAQLTEISENPSIRGACPAAGSCCVGHDSPGCDDPGCCEDICFIDSLCCEDAWNDDCAAFAQLFCPSVCSLESCGGLGDCCSEDSSGCGDAQCCELVCLEDLSCCLSWSPDCVALAVQMCAQCTPPSECPQPGDCCEARFLSGGCERVACCETVCSLDVSCCAGNWGASCARAARDHCLNVCDCVTFGNLDGVPGIDFQDTARFQTCFSGDGAAPVPAACACADYDGDGDADLLDFAYFIEAAGDP